MNLYSKYDNPEALHRHADIDTHVAKIFWQRYVGYDEELQKREDAIAKDPTLACKYAMMYLKKPWPKAEAAIAKDPAAAYKYAQFIIKGPWPKGEAVIAKDMYYSVEYAEGVLKGRFKKGEARIAKTAHGSFEYAKVINEPFIEGEPAIANGDYGYAKKYLQLFPERKEAIETLQGKSK